MGAGDNHLAYNNVIYNNGTGIQIRNGGTGNKAYNNTIYNNKGGDSGGSCFLNVNDGSVIRNNICYRNQTNGINGGGSLTQTNNLYEDPKFVNADAGDFRLRDGSPGIKAGADLSGTFTTDITGGKRPSGKFDLGAYAVGATGGSEGGQASLSAPMNLRLIAVE